MLKFKYELSDKQVNICNDLLVIKDENLSPAEIQSICFKTDDFYEAINEIILVSQK